ncbi:hypothetical protein ALO97_101012 [Pseudomonas syringae pv. tagetis]|uniref:Uncharacterized protein n=1 Tax=Pseudomonas syringae pv. tagetis TaxID=129140 RepID=A0A0Q0B0E1_9PSED|nr:hypothetical protein ALO44_101099 [Pseudomonas syringae pv. tagetis]RMW10549.1 hypothetical protein ALO98_100902 [Pseudomonas syringae pv. tagetis]RMW19884.1 hypothetical protein ALO97_101012 [Pseudomonas syringae pv. tagetis]
MDFFKTLYFLRCSANISLIDQKRLSDGADCSRMDRGWQTPQSPFGRRLNDNAQSRHCTALQALGSARKRVRPTSDSSAARHRLSCSLTMFNLSTHSVL